MVMDCQAQSFLLEQKADSTATLVLLTDTMRQEWKIDYPVYQFQSGDITGDGKAEALVGVIKTTRYDPTLGRRIFVFKNYEGLIRPLWMGSRLGGKLVDFRLLEGRLRAIEQSTTGQYGVTEYVWDKFGFSFHRLLARNISADEARKLFDNDKK